MKRSKLYKSMMMAGALGGLSMLGGLGAGLYAPTASAVNLPANGLGEVLIFPYYTARDNWQTTFSIINTDERNIIAVRLRIAEGENSRDTRDWTLIMSPGDMFAGVIEEGPAGPQLRRAPTDTTCTSPYSAPGSAQALSVDAFSGTSTLANGNVVSDADGGGTTVDRLREGYILAFVMGHSPVVGPAAVALNAAVAGYDAANPGANLAGTLATLRSAVHANGAPNTQAECTAAANLFANAAVRDLNNPNLFLRTTQPSLNSVIRLFGEPDNVLKGNYSFLNVPRGTAAGGNAVALANFVTFTTTGVPAAPLPTCTWMFTSQFGPDLGGFPDVDPWNPLVYTVTDCPNLVTAQNYPDFLMPSLNDALPARAVTFQNGVASANALGVAAATWPAPGANPALPGSAFAAAPYGFLAVSEVLRAATVINEWSINPNLGVSTDWVITHPTKAFFTDRPVSADGDSPQAAVNQIRFPQAAPPFTPWGGPPGSDTDSANDAARSWAPPIVRGGSLRPFARTFNGTSCNQVGFRLFNVDELSSTGPSGPVASPDDPPQNLNLCYETNVIPFTGDDVPTADNPGGVFGSRLLPQQPQLANLYDAIAEVGQAGWMRLDLFTDGRANQNPTPFPIADNTLNGPGLPSVGFMIRQRAIPLNVIDSYSDAADHTVNRDRP